MSTLSVDTIQGKTTAGTVAMPAGAMLQVVQSHITGYTTTASNSNTSTGLTVTITPKFSSSKVLITGNMNGCYSNAVTRYATYELYKGGSFLAKIHQLVGYSHINGQINYGVDWSFSYLDSPNTTSATTYDLQWAAQNGGNSYFNNYGIANNSTRSTLTAYEIAG